jgi:hypothetical protein
MMTSRLSWAWPLIGSLSLACSSTHRTPAPASTPLPTVPTIIPEISPDSGGKGPWTFAYTPGTVAYHITRTATIQREDSAVGQGGTSTNVTRELLTFVADTQGTSIVAVADSFTSTGQQSNHPVQLPAEVSGLFTSHALTIAKDSSDVGACSTVHSLLTTDLRNLVIPLPDSLMPGLIWNDSVSFAGCQAGIPTSTSVARSFRVKGEVIYEGRPVLEILRTDSAHVDGEGGLEQHSLSIHAAGTGSALYYLDPSTGRVVRLTTDQTLTIGVVTLSNASHFRQTSKQEFLLTR